MQTKNYIKTSLEEKNDELLSTNDVAKLINKSPQTVIHLANNNKLNPIKTRSGMRLFLRSEIEKLLVA